MRAIPTKADNVGDVLPAEVFNVNLSTELEAIVSSVGITLDGASGPDTDTAMLVKAIATYASAGDFYADSGAADAYVLGRATSISPLKTLVDGMRVAFLTANASTGVATVNVTTFGVKDIRKVGGAVLPANYIRTDVVNVLRYNSGAGHFELESSGLLDAVLLSNANIIDGDGTAGRNLRVAIFNLGDGTAANTIDVTMSDSFNSEADSQTDIGAGVTKGIFSLNAGGDRLTIDISQAGRTIVGVNMRFNSTGIGYIPRATLTGGTDNLEISLTDVSTGANVDIAADSGAALTAGDFIMEVSYITQT